MLGWKFRPFLCLIALLHHGCHGGGLDLPFETMDTLFDVEDRVKIQSLKDPIPFYRKDLDSDYVAYWQFTVNDDEQIIISAGPYTGDYKLVFQGPLPSMTQLLDRTAGKHGQKCHKYYMLSPDVTLMCEDDKGHVMATTRDSYINFEVKNTSDIAMRYQYVEGNYLKLNQEWIERAKEVKEDGIWDDMSLVPRELIQHKNFMYEDLKDVELQVLHPGQTVKIPYTETEEIRLSSPTHTEEYLCERLKICTADIPGLAGTGLIEKNSYGISYIAITVPETMYGKYIRFNLHIKTATNLVVKRFYIDLNSRSKRATYTPWKEYSVGHEYLFPDYNQHKIKSGCAVGCGPVAWAMIFGYFDRRSHDKTSKYGTGSQHLFRCGADGTTGSASCKAPKTNTSKMKKYFEKLRGILKTFCIKGEGATLQKRMENVKDFFKNRQKSGSPKIVTHKQFFIGFFGVYSKKIRNKGLAGIKAGWPVIPGIRVSGLFSQHYPVATKYRKREKKEKKCFLGICWTKKTDQYDMYLHMGWGGNQNGWRTAEMFFAAYAKY